MQELAYITAFIIARSRWRMRTPSMPAYLEKEEDGDPDGEA
jgi:hypothetical protein